MDEHTDEASRADQPNVTSPLPSGRRVLVLGGSRSGKSRFAEQYFADSELVTYVATAEDYPGDAEWTARVQRHRQRRPASWTTVEAGDPAKVLDHAGDGAPVLIDSVTTWLSRVMTDCGCWAGETRAQAGPRLAASLDALDEAWARTAARAVAVTDEVGSGIIPESASARWFRDVLGDLNQRLAARSDEVWLVTAGIPLRLR